MERKTTTLLTHASRSLLWIQFVAVVWRRNFLKMGTWPILPRPGSTPGQIWQKKHLYACVKNLTLEWNQKYKHYISHAFRSLLCIRFVAVAFQPEEKVHWRRGPPMTYFCLALDLPLDRYGRKTITLVRDHEHFIPTKFHKHPASGTVVKADYVFLYINMH